MRDEKEYKKKQKRLVETALAGYLEKQDINSGYNIIRYSNQRLIRVKEFVSPNVFMEWYPRNQTYVILRLAKKGLLCYNEPFDINQ